MTSVLIDLKTDAPAGPVGQAGSLVATPSRIRVDAEIVTLPSAMVFLVPGDGPVAIELQPTGPSWYYILDLYVGGSLQIRRTVALAGIDPVAWADLVDIDPVTYEPLDPAASGVNELLTIVAMLAANVPTAPLVVGDDLTFGLADGSRINAGNVRGPVGDTTTAVGISPASGAQAIPAGYPGTYRYGINGATVFSLAAGVAGKSYSITVVISMNTLQTITWPVGVLWPEGFKPVFPTGRHAINFLWDGFSWEGVIAGLSFA